MKGGSGSALTRRNPAARTRSMHVLVLSEHNNAGVLRAKAAGASGYVLKDVLMICGHPHYLGGGTYFNDHLKQPTAAPKPR